MQRKVNIKHALETMHKLGWENYVFLIFATLLALSVRFSLLDFRSADLQIWIRVHSIIETNGVKALARGLSLYNPPYLYLLYLVVRFLPMVDKVIAIKIPSLIADFLCAGFVYKLVGLKSRNKDLPLLAYLATLISPTVILNSSFWGQADSIYTAGLIACLFFLMTRKNWLALISFGVAFAFKLQALFFLPFLLIMWLKKEVSWKHFLMIPVVYLISILPAWLIGRPLASLLTIYFTQADTYNLLTLNAPTLYAWFPRGDDLFAILYPAGIAFSATVILTFAFVVYRSPARLSTMQFMELALFTALIVPFTLPKMHERFFFPADVLSVAFGFYFPDYFYVPLAVNLISFFSYQYFLFRTQPIPTAYLALAMAVIIAIIGRKIYRGICGADNASPKEEIQP